MKIKTKVLNSIYRFSAVMLVLFILPSGAFASKNKPAFTPVENIADENFADTQAEMLDSTNEKITELETLSSEISGASNAEEFQEDVFAYIQTRAVDSLKMELGRLEEMVSNSENSTDENLSESLSSRITELNALIADINGSGSLEDLMEIISSSQGMPGMGVGGPMQHGGCDSPTGPGKIPENGADNSTEA